MVSCLIFLGFFLCFQCLINWLVGVNNEGNDDIDKDEIGEFHKRDEVENNSRIVLLIIDQLIHVHDSFPVVLPHEAKKCIKRHDVVIEVYIYPGGIHTGFLICWKLCHDLLVDFSSEELESDTGIDEIERIKGDRKVKKRLDQGSNCPHEVSPELNLVEDTAHAQASNQNAQCQNIYQALVWVIAFASDEVKENWPGHGLVKELNLEHPVNLWESSSQTKCVTFHRNFQTKKDWHEEVKPNHG